MGRSIKQCAPQNEDFERCGYLKIPSPWTQKTIENSPLTDERFYVFQDWSWSNSFRDFLVQLNYQLRITFTLFSKQVELLLLIAVTIFIWTLDSEQRNLNNWFQEIDNGKRIWKDCNSFLTFYVMKKNF